MDSQKVARSKSKASCNNNDDDYNGDAGVKFWIEFTANQMRVTARVRIESYSHTYVDSLVQTKIALTL